MFYNSYITRKHIKLHSEVREYQWRPFFKIKKFEKVDVAIYKFGAELNNQRLQIKYEKPKN